MGLTASEISLIKKILSKHNIPIVLIDNDVEGVDADKIFHDNFNGAKILTEHLIKHGHRKIAIIITELYESSMHNRLEGYKHALESNNININDNFIKSIKLDEEKSFYQIKEKVSELFSCGNSPTSIFIAPTNLAVSTFAFLLENGYKIPEDIALVSFDDYEFADVMNPSLTTLRSVNKEIGKEAANLLLKRIMKEGNKKFQIKSISSDIIYRRSCGCNKK